MKWLDGITDSIDLSLSKHQKTEGQGSLACCHTWGCKELDMTERLNNKEILVNSYCGNLLLTLKSDKGEKNFKNKNKNSTHKYQKHCMGLPWWSSG